MIKFNLKTILFAISTSIISSLGQAIQLSPTIYFIKTIDLGQECAVKKTIMSVDGKSLYKVCRDSYKRCVIEGTCAIVKDDQTQIKTVAFTEKKEVVSASAEMSISTDPVTIEADSDPEYEVINYVKQNKNGEALFMPVDESNCPWGYGVSQICLDPYYTVAADLNYHKAGDVIFVNKLKGIKLPSGEIHSGFLIVRDRGGAIKGANRFDFYTGVLDYRDEKNPFTPVGFASSTSKFEYRKATADETLTAQRLRNYPKIPIHDLKQ